MADSLLTARGLEVTYGGGRLFGGGGHKVLHGVDIDIAHGETIGIVGESGSGKTTLGRALLKLIETSAGEILFDGRDITHIGEDAMRPLRRRMQMIFQDPVSSLSPRMTVFDVVREPMVIQGTASLSEQKERVAELMSLVGLDPRFLNRYPHSFSGGQRQRIGIARAIALEPRLVICDEPVSALDVSVQAQVLNLLKDLQSSFGLTYLFISHNLAVVHYMADRIAVMARGRIVEIAPRHTLFRAAVHPYTQALLRAVPFPDLDRRLDFDTVALKGASNPANWPAPFKPETPGAPLVPFTIGEGHTVLASPSAQPGKLAA
jgi:peptide/nickel transport system ATP-binding protein